MKNYLALLLTLLTSIAFAQTRTMKLDAECVAIRDGVCIDKVEFGYLDGATSNLQIQLDSKGAASDVTALDGRLDIAESDITALESADTALDGRLDTIEADNATQTELDAHINDATDSHDASSVSVVPAGTLAADDVQEGLTELQGDIDTNATAIALKAADNAVVHLTGNESISGTKTFTGYVKMVTTSNGAIPCPVMTTAQRDAIASPANGDCVYNSDTNAPNFYNSTSTSWAEVSGAGTANNLLTNPAFELGTGSWTLTTGAGASESTVKLAPGLKSYKASLTSAQTLELYQVSTTGAAQFNGTVQGMASCRVKTTATNVYVCSRENGSTNLNNCASVTASAGWVNARVPFMLGATSSGVTVISGTLSGSTVTPGALSATTDVYVDDCFVGMAADFDQSPNMSTLKSYTATITGFGTPSAATYHYIQNGTTISLFGKFTTGTVAASAASITFPSGVVLSSTAFSTYRTRGRWWRDNVSASTRKAGTFLIGPTEAAAGFAYFSSDDYTTAAAPSAAINGNSVASTGENIYFEILNIPVENWQATVNTYIDQCQTDIQCANEFVATISAAGVVSDENVDWINGNATISATSTYAISFTTSLFGVAPVCNYDQAANNIGFLYEDVGETTSGVSIRSVNSSSSALAVPFSIRCTRASTDFKARKQIVGSFKDTPKTVGSSGSDIQEVYFGTGANCDSPCTTGTCTICRQTGNKITSVTWTSAGTYQLNGLERNSYTCTGSGLSTAPAPLEGIQIRGTTTSYIDFRTYNPSGSATNAAYARAQCIGVP